MFPAPVSTPLAVLDIRTLDISQVSLGNTGFLQPDPESIIFFGRIYPYSALQGTPLPLPATEALCQGLDDADPARLLMLLGVGEVALRPLYLHMHWHAENQRNLGLIEPRLAVAMQYEYIQYRRLDLLWLQRRVFSRLDRHDTGGHMLFQGHLAMHKRRPDVQWHGHVDVPVHRLLWPHVHPGLALRPEDRLRKRDICPDETHRDCVNPAHFEIAIPMSDRRMIRAGLQNTVQPSMYTRYMHRWTEENVRLSPNNGKLYVHCPQCGAIMPPGVQDSLRLQRDPESSKYNPSPRGRSKCTMCYEHYRAQVGVRADGKTNRRPRSEKARNEEGFERAYAGFLRGAAQQALDQGKVDYESLPASGFDEEAELQAAIDAAFDN